MEEKKVDSLYHVQDMQIETARQLLKTEGEFGGFTFVVCDKHSASKMKSFGVKSIEDIDTDKKFQSAKILADEEKDFLLLGMPNYITPEDSCLMLLQMLDKPSQDAVIEHIEKGKGMGLGPDEMMNAMQEILLSKFNMHPKDLLGKRIRQMIKETNAFAVLKIDDGYTLDQKYDHEPDIVKKIQNYGGLSKSPYAVEAIISTLEMISETRMITVPYVREGEKITEFKEPIIKTVGKDANATGRFANLLGKKDFDA